jgi:hypothetical protein
MADGGLAAESHDGGKMSKPVPMEDVLAVQDALGRYCWYVDSNKGEEWADLYTEDGIFEGTRPEPVIGRAALTQVPASIWNGFQGKMRHQYGNLFVEYGAGDNELVARFYNQVSVWGDGGGKLIMLAVSTATLVRTGAGQPWKIKRNTIELLR